MRAARRAARHQRRSEDVTECLLHYSPTRVYERAPKVKKKVAPRSISASAQMRPPCL
jgi:hypothetical protein